MQETFEIDKKTQLSPRAQSYAITVGGIMVMLAGVAVVLSGVFVQYFSIFAHCPG